MTALAGLEQLAETRGVTFDPTDVNALRALEDASAFVRAYTRQTISAVEDDEVELRGTYSDDLWLPQKPVTGLTSISLRYRDAFVPYEEADLSVWQPVPRRGLLSRYGGWGGPRTTIHVVYDHGYDVIPDDIASAVCAIAARTIVSPAGGGVVTSDSETIGSYTHAVQYADPGVSRAASGVSAVEAAILDRYRNAAMAEA